VARAGNNDSGVGIHRLDKKREWVGAFQRMWSKRQVLQSQVAKRDSRPQPKLIPEADPMQQRFEEPRTKEM